MAFVNEKDKRRTIDYERNAILHYTRSAGMGEADLFELRWGDSIIEFGATRKMPMKDDEVIWSIFQVSIPDNLESKSAEIKNLICESLAEYGYLYTKKTHVIINISERIESFK